MTGEVSQIDQETLSRIRLELERKEASEHTRTIMQGQGKPILSWFDNGYRFVAVKNRIYYSQRWGTFVDFLFHFLVETLTKEWLREEELKPPESRHPILEWFYKTRDFTAKNKANSINGIISGVPIGAMRALIGLAYDFYLCAHNWELPDTLVKRIKDPKNFAGALYEAFVIGVFSKAGFELQFEEESKGLRKHCEFVATHTVTGKQFCVEAKAVSDLNSDTRPDKMKIHRKLKAALAKDAEHDRVVFIELSQADNRGEDGIPLWVDSAIAEVRAIEKSAPAELPCAYLFLTNRPFVHQLDDDNPMEAVSATGFRIPDFPAGRDGQSFREAIKSRARAQEIYALTTAINTHTEIPTSFDERLTEELELPGDVVRLRLGESYVFPNEQGDDVAGVLTSAVVLENESVVFGVYKTENGKQVIATTPLSEAELSLYRRSPETFFGVVQHVGKGINSPFDAYDFIAEGYKNASRERLIELTSEWPDAANLSKLSQQDLLEEYRLRMAEQIWSRHVAEALKQK